MCAPAPARKIKKGDARGPDGMGRVMDGWIGVFLVRGRVLVRSACTRRDYVWHILIEWNVTPSWRWNCTNDWHHLSAARRCLRSCGANRIDAFFCFSCPEYLSSYFCRSLWGHIPRWPLAVGWCRWALFRKKCLSSRDGLRCKIV